MRLILEKHFLDPFNGAFKSGAVITFQDRHVVLYIRIGINLADGDGWRQWIECKSASGIRCCPECRNVVSQSDLIAHAPGGTRFVDCSCGDTAAFVMHDYNSLLDDIKLLFRNKAAWLGGRITKAVMEDLEKALGYSPTPEGLWGNKELARLANPVEVQAMDWVHCALQDGILTLELNLYMNSNDSTSLERLESFVGGWTFATSTADYETNKAIRQIVRCWAAGHLGGHIKPSASQLLTVVTLLRFWANSHEESLKKTAFLMCCSLIHTIQKAKFIVGDDAVDDVLLEHAQEIMDAYKRYMSASNAAHGAAESSAFAKKHWIGHIPMQLLQHHGIWDCFVVERLHCKIKQHSKRVANTTRFERTVLKNLVATHCFDSPVNDMPYLCGRDVPILEGTANALLPSVASKATTHCKFDGVSSVSSGDFARRGSSIGRVVQAVTVGADNVRLMVLVCVARRATATYWNICGVSEELVAWDLADWSLPMVRAVAWQSADANLFLVLS